MQICLTPHELLSIDDALYSPLLYLNGVCVSFISSLPSSDAVLDSKFMCVYLKAYPSPSCLLSVIEYRRRFFHKFGNVLFQMEQMMRSEGIQQLMNSPQFSQMASSPALQSMVDHFLPAVAPQSQSGGRSQQPLNPAALLQQIMPMFSQVCTCIRCGDEGHSWRGGSVA